MFMSPCGVKQGDGKKRTVPLGKKPGEEGPWLFSEMVQTRKLCVPDYH
jgi:hypothetical protein